MFEYHNKGLLLCIGCRHLELDRDFKVSGHGICKKTGEILEMPMIACDDYSRPDIRDILIPHWYREILTPTQCKYMQALYDGKSIHRIAEIYDRTDQSVSMTVKRAKTRIRQYRESMSDYADTDSITYKNAMHGMTVEEADEDAGSNID